MIGSGYSETDLDPRRFLTLFERVLCRNCHSGQAACQCCSARKRIINHCCIPSGRHKVDGEPPKSKWTARMANGGAWLGCRPQQHERGWPGQTILVKRPTPGDMNSRPGPTEGRLRAHRSIFILPRCTTHTQCHVTPSF